MDFEQIDRWCDLFEDRLKAGDKIQVSDFLQQHELPHDVRLVEELQRVSDAYAASSAVDVPPTIDAIARTVDGENSDPDMTSDFSETGSESDSRMKIAGYSILGILGRGGMGVVYKAKQIQADRIVALKVMLNLQAEREGLERFRIEAQSSAQLQHPNIVHLYDVGKSGEVPFFSQEYVPGGTLAQKISKQLLGHKETAEKMLELSEAIAYAHGKGIIHRDLKPANVLVTENGQLKIADFGLARRTEDQSNLTRDGSIIGTPSYMAPEQASGSVYKIGPLCDVYSLGAILYELLTGRPPFKGASVWEVIDLVKDAPPIPPSDLQAGVPKDLETICLKCLRKDPEKRYESAQELAADLKRYLNHEPIQARPVGQWERFVRLCRRHPREARLVGLAASLLVIMAIGGTIFGLQMQEQRNEIQKQKDALAAEKKISDERLVLANERLAAHRQLISTSVNRLPQYAEGIPLSEGLQEELASLVEQHLLQEVESAEVGPSKNRGLLAVELRRGDVKLSEALSAKYDSSTFELFSRLLDEAKIHFDEAMRLASLVSESGEGDRPKAIANLALANSRSAAAAGAGEEHVTATESFNKAIALRSEAAELPDGEEPRSRRVAEYGRELANFAAYHLERSESETDPSVGRQHLEKAAEYSSLAMEKLEQAIDELPENDTYTFNARRDFALAAFYKALAASEVINDPAIALEAFDAALATNLELIQDQPNRIAHQRNFLTSVSKFGDYLLVQAGDPKRAQANYGQAFLKLRSLWLDPSMIEMRDGEFGLAKTCYRLGLTAVATSDKARADKYFGRCEAIREVEMMFLLDGRENRENPDLLLTPRIGLMLAQARTGNLEPAIEEAYNLIERANDPTPIETGFTRDRLFLQAAAGLGIAAQQAQPEETRNRLLDEAIQAMHAAIEHGFHDRDYLLADPDLTPLKSSQEFSTLLANLENPIPR